MSDFLDHLFDPAASGNKGREQLRYKERIRALILEAPAVRRLSLPVSLDVIPALILPRAMISSEGLPPGYELVLQESLSDHGVSNFRHWKSIDAVTPIWRMDPVSSEEQVLETRAMGADAYLLDVKQQDQATLQYLVEVGRDYGLPAILSCRSAEELALALEIQDAPYLRLQGEVAATSLLSFEKLKGRIAMLAFEHGSERPTSTADWVCSLISEETYSTQVAEESDD